MTIAEQVTHSRRGKTPRVLWMAGIAVLIPVVIPIVLLFWRVVGASDAAWQTLFSARTGALLIRTAVFTAAVTAAATAIGVASAWLVARTTLTLRTTFGVLLALPLVIPSYVLALTLISAFGPRGLFADLTGIPLPQLSGALGAWLALTLATYPYVYLVVFVRLGRMDGRLEDAAQGLGASRNRVFWTVTLPQLRPHVAAGALLVALYTLSDFGAVSLMRFDAFTNVIYAQYQGRLDRTPSAVLSAALILIAVVVLIIERRTRGKAAYYSARPEREILPLTLSKGQHRGALGFVVAVVGGALVLPVSVLAVWLFRGLTRGDTLLLRADAVWGSIGVSLAAGVLAALLVIPLLLLTVRYRNRFAGAVETVVYLIYSLPHIAVGLAMVVFAANYLTFFYQSATLLIITYSVVFLAQALGPGRAALLRVSPHLEEAARSLGKSPFEALRDVTFPLVYRGLAAGGVLVFLTTMKELPITLLLRPTGFDTLAVRIWSSANDLFYARAAAPALLLLAVSAVPMYLLVIRPRETPT